MENVFGVLRTNPVPSSSTRSSCPPSHWPPPHASQHQPLLKPILQRLHFHTLPCREVSTLLRGLTNSEAAARTYEAPLTISSPIWNVIVKGWFLVSNKKKKLMTTRTTGGGTWKHLLCAPKYQALFHSTLHRESRYILLTAQYIMDCYQPHCRRESQGLGKPRSQRLRKRKLKFEPRAVWHQSSGP